MKTILTGLAMVFSLASGQDVSENISSGDEGSWGNTILVNITGFANDSGEAVLALFTREEWSFPPNPEQAGIVRHLSIVNLAVNAEITDVPHGTYFAMAFHDENGNGRFDGEDEMVGAAGDLPQMQSEPSPPSFEDNSFTLNGSASALRIIVRKRPSGAGEGMPGGGRPGGGGGRPFQP